MHSILVRGYKMVKCFIDGDCLCVVGKDFIDIQESDSVFIKLTETHINNINSLEE